MSQGRSIVLKKWKSTRICFSFQKKIVNIVLFCMIKEEEKVGKHHNLMGLTGLK